jgi:hypothetical protein
MRRPSSLRGSISTLIMRKDISRLVMLTSENGFTETEKKALRLSIKKEEKKKEFFGLSRSSCAVKAKCKHAKKAASEM